MVQSESKTRYNELMQTTDMKTKDFPSELPTSDTDSEKLVPRKDMQSIPERIFLSDDEVHSLNQSLVNRAKSVCSLYSIQFAQLTIIQRKFVTHYRCGKCGLLPLFNLDLSHIKRVRCRKCGHLVSFRQTGKYGKIRKEIAIELMKVDS